MKNKLFGAAIGLGLALGMAIPAQAQKATVNIYTSLENDQLAPFKAAM